MIGSSRRAAIGMSAACAIVAGCALVPRTTSGARIGDGDAYAAGMFTTGRVMEVAAGLRSIEGRLAVCGAWRSGDRLDRGYAREALSAGFVSADGERLVQNLGFFLQRDGGASLDGAAANCADAGRAWTDADAARAVRITLPNSIVERDCDVVDGGSCHIVRFRQIADDPAL